MSRKLNILLIEDSQNDRIAVIDAIPKDKVTIDVALDPEGKINDDMILQRLRDKRYDTVILDLAWNNEDDRKLTEMANISDIEMLEKPDSDLPGGLSLLRKLKKTQCRTPPILILTNYYYDSVIKLAMRNGAGWIIQKPVDPDKNLLEELVYSACRYGAIDERASQLEEALQEKNKFGNILGNSKVMKNVFQKIKTVASDPDLPVLLQGKSGTGKELFARAIHKSSPRRDRTFLVINCPGVADQLLESELFGHIKGAFTSAIADKKGKLELADGGTVFLDEIADLSPVAQAKLLRFLQFKEVEPVGSTETFKVDVRIISATDQDLKGCIQKGTFRDALFFRLGTLIYLPPLVEREGDIILLAKHFVKKYAKGKDMIISPSAREFLCKFNWPGNVRQLENSMQHAVAFAKSRDSKTISFEDLPEEIIGVEPVSTLGSMSGANLSEKLREVERFLLIEALEKSEGSRKHAQGLLGITQDQMKKLIMRHNLQGFRCS